MAYPAKIFSTILLETKSYSDTQSLSRSKSTKQTNQLLIAAVCVRKTTRASLASVEATIR